MSTTAACLTGEWTIHAIAQQRETLMPWVEQGCHLFDATGITDMDTAGLQLLLAAQRSLAMQGREIGLLQSSSVVKDVLQAYGLDSSLQPAQAGEGAL